MKNLPILNQLSDKQWALLVQLFRYAVVGFGVTLAQAAVYLALADLAHIHVQIANFAGYIVAVMLGYVLHGAISFKGQTEDSSAAAHAGRSVRFVLVSLISYGLNAFWVWLFVTYLRLPNWAPTPAMLFVTPAVVFVLNKKWVFR